MEFVVSAFADEADRMLDAQMEACRENGINHIEMRGVDGRNVSDLTAAEAKEIAKRLDAQGFRLSAVGSPLGKIGIEDDFAPHLEKFKATAELANILGTPNIRLFSFFIPHGKDPDAYQAAVFGRLAAFADEGKKAGVRCCHENEKDIYGDMASRCHALLERFQGDIRGVFDFANFVQCGQETLSAYALLEPHIEYFHIKDALAGGQVVPAGEGDGNVREILQKAAAKPRRCFLSLEPHLAVFEGFAALEQGGESMRQPYTYASGREAFNAAAQALRRMLADMGYREKSTPDGMVWCN